MPKMKTHSSAKKRFKVSASGKVKFRHANKNHIQGKMTPKRIRHLRADGLLCEADETRIKRMLVQE